MLSQNESKPVVRFEPRTAGCKARKQPLCRQPEAIGRDLSSLKTILKGPAPDSFYTNGNDPHTIKK